MTARTRIIITTLLACHWFLFSPLLTSQLRVSGGQQLASPNATQLASTRAPADLDDTGPDASPSTTQNPPQSAPSKSGVSVLNDDGQEDTHTEEIIQQELRASPTGQDSGPPRPSMNIALGQNEVLLRADQQEKNQDIYHARGHVEVRFRNYILHADEVTYDSTTGHVVATGHVVFDGGQHNEHLVGSHTTYDVSRDTGTFYDVTGSTGVRVKNRTMFLTSSTPFFFTGKVVDKLGPDRYRVNHGEVTSCQLPKPKWDFEGRTGIIEMGEEAQMRHATLRIRGIPVFYFPFIEHPVDNLGRKSGFLIPVFGQSSTRGTIFGDGFFWAINRSNDATIGAELYSARGWAQHGEIRSIGRNYSFRADYFGVVDEQGYPGTGQNQGGEELHANGAIALPHDWRGVLSVDYLSSYIFREAFAPSFLLAIDSEVFSDGFLIRDKNGYSLSFLVSRYQDYQSVNPGDFIDIAHTPSLEFSTVERPFSASHFVYAYDFAADGVSRHQIGFQTAPVVGRLDGHPYVALPEFFHGWTLRPEAGVQETYYTQRLVAGTTSVAPQTISDPINRNVFSTSMEVRPPSLSKIFDRKLFGYVVKHTVEPRVVYRYQTGINDFSQIIRFDQRDILADTNEVEYGVVNRIYAKKTKSNPECFLRPLKSSSSAPQSNLLASTTKTDAKTGKDTACDDSHGAAREILSWELAQKYFFDPTFGGALVPGQRNVFDSTADFTGIAFLTEPRKFSPIISRLRVQDANSDFQWAVDYDPVLHQLNASTIFAGHRFSSNWYVAGGQSYLNVTGQNGLTSTTTPDIFNQYRVLVQYGGMNHKGLSAAASVSIDSQLSYIQGATVQGTYNWDCCGIAVEYLRWALGSTRNENAYRFSFSLANIGTFGTIRRLQRLY
jgi:LPS-assembly protein